MSDIVRFSPKELDRVRRVVREFRDAVAPYGKDVEVEVKDWAFSAGASQKGTLIDVAIELELKPKKPSVHEGEQKPATPNVG